MAACVGSFVSLESCDIPLAIVTIEHYDIRNALPTVIMKGNIVLEEVINKHPLPVTVLSAVTYF